MAEGSSKGYPAGSGGDWKSWLDDPDVVEVSAEAAAGWSSSGRQKRKLTQVVPSDIIDLDADDGPDGVMIIDEKIKNHKNKQAAVHMDWPEHAKNGISADFAGPNAIPVTKVGPWDGLGGYHNNVAIPTAIPITNVGAWDGLGGYHNNVAGPIAIPATDFFPWDGLMLAPHYYGQFVDAPGEEHNKYYSNTTSIIESGSSFNSANDYMGIQPGKSGADNYMGIPPGNSGANSYMGIPPGKSGVNNYMGIPPGNYGANSYMGIPPGMEAVLPQGTSSEMPHQTSHTKIVNSEVDEKYKAFKQFDTVNDHADHFYALPGKSKVNAVKKPPKAWVKRIQHEWKVLESDLPDTIYVRVYEDRMELLRAVIVGPAGTPYHDGLFFFDVYFPSRYPSKPPLVNYRSGGLRLNPNLYDNGKVCLSLLNTWDGTGCEKWNPSNSTMLQVLVSIQALVLNAKPYFNEPGYAMYANTPQGEKQSMAYNEEVFLLSCRTMQYSLRNPPKHFEDFIVGHFRNYGRKILKGCKSYMAGAQVGCLVGDSVQDVDEGDKSCSTKFKASLKVSFGVLMKEFASIGINCDEFQNPEPAKPTAGTLLIMKLQEQKVMKTKK